MDAQTALVAAHWITTEAGASRHDIEVMSYIAARPLPTGDVDVAKAFVRKTCTGVTEPQIAAAVITTGAQGYYRFMNLPCVLTL